MCLAVELRIVPEICIGIGEETETVFEAEYAPRGIVDALHAYAFFLHKLLEEGAEVEVVWFHRHVDACIDGHFDSFLLVGGDVLACVEIVDVGPVGDDHAIPAEVFLEPACEPFIACMHGHAVDRSAVDHKAQCAGLNTSPKRLEEFFAKFGGRYICRSSVLAGAGGAVTEVMFHACGYMVGAYMVGVVALEPAYLLRTHDGVDERILSEVFPYAWPARIAGEIDCRRICPGTVGGACLVCGDGSGLAGHFGVERGSDIDVLREENAAERVCGAVVLVETVDAWNSYLLHGYFLEISDYFFPFGGSLRRGATGSVEDRAYFIYGDSFVHFVGVEKEFTVFPRAEYIDRQFGHLADFFIEAHGCESLFDSRFNLGILRNSRLYGSCSERASGDCGYCKHSFDFHAFLFKAFIDFEAHSGIVVGAFPETGFIVGAVNAAVLTAPVPLSVFIVNDIFGDVLPSLRGFFEGGRVAVIAVEPYETDHLFGLYPPMPVVVEASVGVALIDHRAVGATAAEGSVGDMFCGVERACKKGLVGEYLSCFEEQPRGFDVVAV